MSPNKPKVEPKVEVELLPPGPKRWVSRTVPINPQTTLTGAGRSVPKRKGNP